MIDKINIGGHIWGIAFDAKRANAAEYQGVVVYRDMTIYLDDTLCRGRINIILWHEIIHVILYQAGLQEVKNHEQLADALSHGIDQVLRDNPWLTDMEKE